MYPVTQVPGLWVSDLMCEEMERQISHMVAPKLRQIQQNAIESVYELSLHWWARFSAYLRNRMPPFEVAL